MDDAGSPFEKAADDLDADGGVDHFVGQPAVDEFYFLGILGPRWWCP
ncbi:hypothetical protein NRF20_41710 [Streptomyces sp. R-74717]